jgi:hypothetical protein
MPARDPWTPQEQEMMELMAGKARVARALTQIRWCLDYATTPKAGSGAQGSHEHEPASAEASPLPHSRR